MWTSSLIREYVTQINYCLIKVGGDRFGEMEIKSCSKRYIYARQH